MAPLPALNRPTNLFTSGLRGAVNFSYRPQVDDDLLDGDDEFSSSINSGGPNQGLHFDHYGPYAYNQPRQGYLVYGGSTGVGLPRNISFSFQSNAPVTPVEVPCPDQSALLSSNIDNAIDSKASEVKSDNLLESHMLQEQQSTAPTNPTSQVVSMVKEGNLNITDTKFN